MNPVFNQRINIQFSNDISLTIKREDLIHPFVSGNKFRKLKYNLLQAKAENKTTLLTFGGAFFASFPLFYATSFSGAYWAWTTLLFSFIVQAPSGIIPRSSA